MTLRNGKELEVPKAVADFEEAKAKAETEIPKEIAIPSIPVKAPPLPFPPRNHKTFKKDDKEKEILETFRKVEVNIPLLDAIKQVAKYAKFLKELCTNKRKLKNDERVTVGENVSAVLQRKMPPKCKDPGMFTIPCRIENTRFEKAMLDLGASINVMPLSVYASLNLGPLKQTSVIIQLADRTKTYPQGVIEDVLVQVNELIFPADFYIVDMEDDTSPNPSHILLGRPFLKTTRTMIDVHNGTLTMEFDGEKIQFNIYDAMRYPSDVNHVFAIDIIDSLVQVSFEQGHKESLDVAITNSMDLDKEEEMEQSQELSETVAALHSLPKISAKYAISSIQLPVSHKKLLPSVEQAPILELKPLPAHLKYAYLGTHETLPVIIASNLTKVQEDKLLRVLRDHITVFGWTIADIKGISSAMCMHRILLEDGAKPT